MLYAGAHDMEVRFGESELVDITDRADAGLYNEEFVQAALEDACAEIDSYIGARYELPLSGIPLLLRLLCCDIARYRLYDDSPTEVVSSRYSNATLQLKAIADGSAQLYYEYGPVPLKGGMLAARKPLSFGGDFEKAYEQQL